VPALTVNDWCQSGLTYRQYCYDRRNGDVKILRRGVRGETVIDARSIRRADRLRVIERVMGRVPREEHRALYTVDMDREAEAFFAAYEKTDLFSPFCCDFGRVESLCSAQAYSASRTS